MLVRFNSNVAGEMLMFSDVARRLLQCAGKACGARGVILAAEVPEIVARLRAAVAGDKASAAAAGAEKDVDGDGDGDENPNPVVSLGQRAQPFIELLELTARDADGFVLWEAPSDFER